MTKIMQQFKAAKMLNQEIRKVIGEHWQQDRTCVRNVALLVKRCEQQQAVIELYTDGDKVEFYKLMKEIRGQSNATS